ncbi:hypothetical protein BN946_scf184895.g9 [Trametes cinnabarina]|uniref:F-box domain-containing protein n=1 Tax=Pycnoporus cinnabarinus TaxID=5643 RepID=A0A060SSP1_PYCCI|nr:hypothetical protein BN946_scf184895.g9 [Trametes cinnabarina]
MKTIPRTRKGLEYLPFDVLLQLFDNMPARDVVHVLCTCRAFYSLASDDAMWRSLSSRYGLHDNTYFGGRSWYIVYTRLLHTYGPMLGLWAGDHAYTGNVIEVRLEAGDLHTQGGIAFDMWCFRVLEPEEFGGPEMPELPTYRRLVRVDFTGTSTQNGPATTRCCCGGRLPTHRAQLSLLSSTTLGFYLLTRQGRYPHPDFPSADFHAWVDKSRYPRQMCSPAPYIDQTDLVPPQRRLAMVYTAPTAYLKPCAVSLTCEQGCINRQRPFLGFEEASPFHPRYYPLCHDDDHPWMDPFSQDWSAKNLAGLWLGSHGPHGTEVLYVEWTTHPPRLRAWKVTGDENVPRGALSWEASMGDPVRLSGSEHALCAKCLGDPVAYKFFGGTGTFSGRGFM